MLLWDLKDNDILLANVPLPFKILSLNGSGRLSCRFVPSFICSCTFFTISSGSPQLSLFPFSINSGIQWHGYLKYTHIYTHPWRHTHIYLFLKQNFWEGRWLVIFTHRFLSKFHIFDFRMVQGPAHGWNVPTNMVSEGNRNLCSSQALEGLKEKVIMGGTGDSQVYPDKGEQAPCLPRPPPHLQLHLEMDHLQILVGYIPAPG